MDAFRVLSSDRLKHRSSLKCQHVPVPPGDPAGSPQDQCCIVQTLQNSTFHQRNPPHETLNTSRLVEGQFFKKTTSTYAEVTYRYQQAL